MAGGQGVWIRNIPESRDRKLAEVSSQITAPPIISPDGAYVAFVAASMNTTVASTSSGVTFTAAQERSSPREWDGHLLSLTRADPKMKRYQQIYFDADSQTVTRQEPWKDSSDIRECFPEKIVEVCVDSDQRFSARPLNSSVTKRQPLFRTLVTGIGRILIHPKKTYSIGTTPVTVRMYFEGAAST